MVAWPHVLLHSKHSLDLLSKHSLEGLLMFGFEVRVLFGFSVPMDILVLRFLEVDHPTQGHLHD